MKVKSTVKLDGRCFRASFLKSFLVKYSNYISFSDLRIVEPLGNKSNFENDNEEGSVVNENKSEKNQQPEINNGELLYNLMKQVNLLHETNSKMFRNLHETKGKLFKKRIH